MVKSGNAARQRGQWSLIGTLVAVAILILLAALYIPRLIKPQAGAGGEEATAMQRAQGTTCTIYVPQFNAAVMQYKQDNGRPPASLNDLKKYGVTDDMIQSPGCSFQMDPATGNVTNGPAPPAAASPGSPASPVTPPPPNGGTRGPGGVTIPNIPTAGGGL